MPYVFLDAGADYMDDEPIAVGPYETEAEAALDADGRTIISLMSYLDYAKGVDKYDEEDGEYWVLDADDVEVSGPYKTEQGARREAEDREEEEGGPLHVIYSRD